MRKYDDQYFQSFQEWLNRASSWLTIYGPDVHAICYDTKGRVCSCGGDFMQAREDKAFPVRWIWPVQVAEMMAKARGETTAAEVE